MTAKAFRFLLRQDLAIVQLVVAPVMVMAMATADFPAAFLRRAREMGFRQVFAAVSFAARFSPGTDLFAVVPFVVCRRRPFATADFVPAADPFDPFVAVVAAGPGFVGSAAVADPFDLSVVAAVAAVAVDLSAADPSVVVADPGFVGSAVFAACLACSVCSVAVALVKEKVVAVPFCSLTLRSSF